MENLSETNFFNADGDMPTQYPIGSSYGRFYETNFLMLMETCQHNILLEVHMEDFYETNFFNADGDMPT